MRLTQSVNNAGYSLSTTLISRMCLNLRDPEIQGDSRRIGRWAFRRRSQAHGTVGSGGYRMPSFRFPNSTLASEGDIVLTSRTTDSDVTRLAYAT